jgi:hypothetical protein
MLKVMWCIMLGIRLRIIWSDSCRMLAMIPSASIQITLGIPLLGKSSWNGNETQEDSTFFSKSGLGETSYSSKRAFTGL